jgi:hypothetical protein
MDGPPGWIAAIQAHAKGSNKAWATPAHLRGELALEGVCGAGGARVDGKRGAFLRNEECRTDDEEGEEGGEAEDEGDAVLLDEGAREVGTDDTAHRS